MMSIISKLSKTEYLHEYLKDRRNEGTKHMNKLYISIVRWEKEYINCKHIKQEGEIKLSRKTKL